MYEYIKAMYRSVFHAEDLPRFIEAGWITEEQATEITKIHGPEPAAKFK